AMAAEPPGRREGRAGAGWGRAEALSRCQQGQAQMRSGIMAATVAISRVRIIAGAISYSRAIVRGNGRRGGLRDRHRLHQAPGGTTQERKPFTVTRTEVGHEPARGFPQLRIRRHMAETHDVAELVKDG